MKRIFSIDLDGCSDACPSFRSDDGGGFCEPQDFCKAAHKKIEPRKHIDGFPEWCPLYYKM